MDVGIDQAREQRLSLPLDDRGARRCLEVRPNGNDGLFVEQHGSIGKEPRAVKDRGVGDQCSRVHGRKHTLLVWEGNLSRGMYTRRHNPSEAPV